MIKILVADDEPDLESLIRQKFRKKIREQEYDFVFASNGKQALEKLRQHTDVAIVLSDINMPEMDGLTLLTLLNEASPLTKAVMVSAYGDMANIRTAMNRGAYDFVCKPVDFADLELTMEKTIKHVEQLKETLKAIKENNILRMYVDENVLTFMGTKEYEASLMANETIDATIVFIDICGFTAITESAPPNTVVNLLNQYFDVMVREILAQGGRVDKFIGDAVMAVFNGPHHLDNAVEACLKVRAEIEALPKELNATFSPKVSIGINSGEVVSGNIGSASLRRLDYTSIGDVVNKAQRLQSAAEAGQIIISEETYHKIKDSFNCRIIGNVVLKNKKEAVVIYEVLE